MDITVCDFNNYTDKKRYDDVNNCYREPIWSKNLAEVSRKEHECMQNEFFGFVLHL